MRILTASDVRSALSMTEAIQAAREAFVALSSGRALVPLRGVLEVSGGVTLTMPAHVEGSPITSVKVVSVYPGNPGRGLPTIHATVLVIDADTGAPIALMDGASLTAIRTGAASGLATDLLARRGATTLGVLGAGVQARTQVEAVCAVRPIEEIRVFSPRNPHSLVEELREKHDARVSAVESAHAAAECADVIVVATTSKTPVLHARDVEPGAHVNAIGSFKPNVQEVAADLVIKAKIVVDHRESAWAETGDLIIPRDRGLLRETSIHAELGEVAAGLATGRTSDEEITLFKSVGNAVQDATAALRVLSAARERGLGTEVEL